MLLELNLRSYIPSLYLNSMSQKAVTRLGPYLRGSDYRREEYREQRCLGAMCWAHIRITWEAF